MDNINTGGTDECAQRAYPIKVTIPAVAGE